MADRQRGNAFLIAAVLLPALIVGFFLLAAAIPRWSVPPPGYDLVIRVGGLYDRAPPGVLVDYRVADGQVEALVRPVPPNAYPQAWTLFLFDHATLNVTEIPVDVPVSMAADEPARTLVVDALKGRNVLPQTKAPDGYELRSGDYRSPGLVGDLFGMRRYDRGVSLVNRGRVVPLGLPEPYRAIAPVYSVGWIVD